MASSWHKFSSHRHLLHLKLWDTEPKASKIRAAITRAQGGGRREDGEGGRREDGEEGGRGREEGGRMEGGRREEEEGRRRRRRSRVKAELSPRGEEQQQ